MNPSSYEARKSRYHYSEATICFAQSKLNANKRIKPDLEEKGFAHIREAYRLINREMPS